jgi:hypothetical protein
MTNSIPASRFVNVIPGVLGTGGNPKSLNAIMLTHDTSIPVGTVQGFGNLLAVQNWFGANSPEAAVAAVYFTGFVGCTQLPSVLYFSQYTGGQVAAYLRGGSLAAMTLAQLQAITGVLQLTINGEIVTTTSINLSGATSFSNAASLITTALDATGDIFNGTASTSGSSTTLTIATTVSGNLHVGDLIVGTGITGGTTIASIGTYNGTTGTVILSAAANVSASTPVTVSSTAVCTYDALRSAFVITSPTTGVNSTIGFATGSAFTTGLLLTSAMGAVLSQGAAAATPAAVMNGILGVTQNWATFMTVFQPAELVMEAFAAWVNAQDEQYIYVNWDSNTLAFATPPQPTTFAQITAAYNGVVSVYDAVGTIAAFVCGAIASFDFSATNGYTLFAGRANALLTPNVTDLTTFNNLVANGYNCYAAVATANQKFQWFQNGQISGAWSWIDEFAFQIWLNSELQLAGMELIANTKSIPYNDAGIALQHAAYKDPVTAGVNFGGIQKGIVLSAAQIAEVNAAAGVAIDSVLFQSGWYLQIKLPTPQVQGTRGPFPSTLWYCNAGGAQQLTLNSIDIQ